MNTLMEFAQKMMRSVTESEMAPASQAEAFRAIAKVVEALAPYEEPTTADDQEEGYMVSYYLPGDTQSRTLFLKVENHNGENIRQLAQYVFANTRIESVVAGHSNGATPSLNLDASWINLGRTKM